MKMQPDGSVTTDAAKPMLTAGLLGATVPVLPGPGQITNARLAEIERRILDIEAALWPCGK